VPLETTTRTSLVEQVIEQLRAQVASGAWTVGARIPTEPELAGSLGVGRNTVREAIRALVHAGVLESRQGSGTYVRAQTELSGVVRRRVADAATRDVFEVRRALEVEAARLAAARRTSDDIAALRAALERCESSWRSGDVAAFAAADAEFHKVAVDASRNPVLIDLYAELGDAVRAGVATVAADSGRHIDHTPIVAAIEAGDVDAAMKEAGCYLSELLTESG
jgi:DNA-binding FadR family transcriptional regulator